jgi:hypothetical protein
VEHYQKALTIFNGLNIKLRQAAVYNAIAEVFQSDKLFDKCLNYRKRALEIARSLKDFNQQANLNNNIGGTF